MATRLPKWIVAWLVITSFVVLWDGLFVLLRPESMKGGKYSDIFSPYELYTQIDKAYANLHNGWIKTQSIANLAEIFLNFVVVMLHFSGSSKAIPLCLIVLSFTFWKTILYFGMEAVEEYVNIKHNSVQDLVLLYIIPNGIWVIVPFLSLMWCFNACSSLFASTPRGTPSSNKNKNKTN